jgi:hypothetical protein
MSELPPSPEPTPATPAPADAPLSAPSATTTITRVPPVGEEIHLPGPSLLPIFNAAGITLTVIGTTLGIEFVIIGLILFLFTTVKWIMSTRKDIAELPLDHSDGHGGHGGGGHH